MHRKIQDAQVSRHVIVSLALQCELRLSLLGARKGHPSMSRRLHPIVKIDTFTCTLPLLLHDRKTGSASPAPLLDIVCLALPVVHCSSCILPCGRLINCAFGMGVAFSLVHLRTGRAPGAPFLPSACSAFVPCRSGHAGNHLDFTQVAFCVRRLPEVAYIAVIPPALPQVHLLPWTLPRHRSFSSLPVVRLVFASLGCRTRAYLCDHQQATRPHESAACGAALGSVVDCVGLGTPLGSLISGGAPTLLCCCLWCSSCPLHPL